MKGAGRSIGSRPAAALLIAGTLLLTWLVGMVSLTAVTARFVQERYLDRHGSRALELTEKAMREPAALSSDLMQERLRQLLDWNDLQLHRPQQPVIGGTSRVPLRDAEKWTAATAVFDGDRTLLGSAGDPTGPVKYMGMEYAGLAELVREVGSRTGGDLYLYTARTGDQLVIFSTAACVRDESGTHFRPRYVWEEDYQEGDVPELLYYTVCAVLCSPLKTAMGELVYLYCITFFLTILLIWLLVGWTDRNLILPVVRVNEALEGNWEELHSHGLPLRRFREQEALMAHYRDQRDLRRMDQNELTRLKTALDYARSAEENRRLMVSNIAHELKTPLAVIHSYAEGLKEHIAEEKREKYLNTILSEAEHSDAIVLEMLDLSRLEAGKVRLSRDDFDLGALVRSAFDRLAPAAQARGLRVELELPETCPVTADQSRMAQVVENLASNAVKYTTRGGSIHARIRAFQDRTEFCIRNDSPNLSQEALDRIWDSFYRADPSRTGQGGTGLGLAIARQIVELHGGSCSARNIEGGVEFSFTLPK